MAVQLLTKYTRASASPAGSCHGGAYLYCHANIGTDGGPVKEVSTVVGLGIIVLSSLIGNEWVEWGCVISGGVPER